MSPANNSVTKLVVASGKGGVGKSMLTSALAVLFSKEKKVVAVDCDVDAPNLAIWLNEVKEWERVVPVVTSAKPEIDYEKCNGCGLCAQHCRFGAMKRSFAQVWNLAEEKKTTLRKAAYFIAISRVVEAEKSKRKKPK